jgi:hypothetical protein
MTRSITLTRSETPTPSNTPSYIRTPVPKTKESTKTEEATIETATEILIPTEVSTEVAILTPTPTQVAEDILISNWSIEPKEFQVIKVTTGMVCYGEQVGNKKEVISIIHSNFNQEIVIRNGDCVKVPSYELPYFVYLLREGGIYYPVVTMEYAEPENDIRRGCSISDVFFGGGIKAVKPINGVTCWD